MRRILLVLGLLAVLAAALTAVLMAGGGGEPARAAFPGANGKIAFSRVEDLKAGIPDIYVMNADGTEPTRLRGGFTPAWSPDGTKIAFLDVQVDIGISVMNADGSGVTHLTNAFRDGTPAWSADGTKIVFESERDAEPGCFFLVCNSEIYVMNADGSEVTRLTNHPRADFAPAWSPDGTKIAFTSNRDDPDPVECSCNNEIYVMNADGSDLTRLTSTLGFDEYPNWSPDGTKIAFDSTRDDKFEIYVMNADGSGQTRLTDNVVPDNRPAWSPDGSKIAFESAQLIDPEFKVSGPGEIYVMNADGSDRTRLTGDPLLATEDAFPDWQPMPAQEPTATPTAASESPSAVTPIATPTHVATVAAAALPTTGSGLGGGSGLPWLIAALVGVGIASAAGYGALRLRLR